MSEPSSQAECSFCGHTHLSVGRVCAFGFDSPHGEAMCGCEKQAPSKPIVINNRCKCSHDRFRHCYDTVDGPCSKPDCDCGAYAPVTVETVELPELEPETDSGDRMAAAMQGLWKASDRECAEMVRKFAARHGVHQDDLPEPKPFEIPSIQTGCAVLHKDGEGNVAPCPDEAPPERPSWTDTLRAWATPQPERRPPLTVQYSVAGGHPYEVSIPGDASVTAEDGALIVKHPSAQILAITRVAPMEG